MHQQSTAWLLTAYPRWIGKHSFYVEHGDWFVAACAALAALGFLAVRTPLVQQAPLRPRD